MKWMDYREKLGIGFGDESKFRVLSANIQNYVQNIIRDAYNDNSYFQYCQMVGELYMKSSYGYPYQYLSKSLCACHSLRELIAHIVAFYNTYNPLDSEQAFFKPTNKANVLKYLKQTLDNIKIPFEIVTDTDGIFIFPKGAKELDDALVSEPLEWLKEYPNTYKTYVIALKQYTDGIYIRDVADNLRKALEGFLQEFLGNTKKS